MHLLRGDVLIADATTASHKCRAVCGDAVVYVGDTQGGDEMLGFLLGDLGYFGWYNP